MRTRLWEMEVLRGVLSIAFSVAFFILRVYSMYVLIYAFGAYLVVDGVFDLSRIVSRKTWSRRNIIMSFAGIASIVTGVISFVLPAVTLFSVAAIMIVRMIIRGVQIIVEAGRARKRSWWKVLYGIFLVLLGVLLLIPPVLVIVTIFLIFFICIYSLFDGLFMLARGLMLRFAPSRVMALALQSSDAQLDMNSDLSPTTRRALIFVRRRGANGLGHVGWSFEWNNGWFNVGAIENRSGRFFSPAGENGFWTAHTLDPISTIQKHGKQYDEYRLFFVTQPQPKQAWQTIVWISRLSYTVLRHNCSDATYDVLRSYGVIGLRDPAQEFAPNDWYDALPGTSYLIPAHPTLPIHVHQVSERALPTSEILLTIPTRFNGTPPPWRFRGLRGWTEIMQAFDKMLSDVGSSLILLCKVLLKRRK